MSYNNRPEKIFTDEDISAAIEYVQSEDPKTWAEYLQIEKVEMEVDDIFPSIMRLVIMKLNERGLQIENHWELIDVMSLVRRSAIKIAQTM